MLWTSKNERIFYKSSASVFPFITPSAATCNATIFDRTTLSHVTNIKENASLQYNSPSVRMEADEHALFINDKAMSFLEHFEYSIVMLFI